MSDETQSIPPLAPRPEVLEFLLTRRSRPAKTLSAPYPDRADLEVMLRAAARTPDHGKLEPWRFIVLDRPALDRLAALVERRGEALAKTPEDIAKAARSYTDSGCAIAVISAPVASEKIPQSEQLLSAGAVCLALVNAALALGWGANWLSGWPSHDRGFVEAGLGLAEGETVAGIIHLGREGAVPPERPRPDLGAKVTWPAP